MLVTRKVVLIAAFCLPLFFVNCSSNNKSDSKEEKLVSELEYDELVYRFNDASVAPEYHRSFSIGITKDRISKTVDSYDSIISSTSKTITIEDWKELTQVVKHAKIRNCELNDAGGCTGGTGVSITCYSNNEKVFQGSYYRCSGKKEGDLCGAPESVLNYLTNLLNETNE